MSDVSMIHREPSPSGKPAGTLSLLSAHPIGLPSASFCYIGNGSRFGFGADQAADSVDEFPKAIKTSNRNPQGKRREAPRAAGIHPGKFSILEAEIEKEDRADG